MGAHKEQKSKLDGKVVVITGASSGIGRAAALEFAREGCRLVLGSRDAASLDEVVAECRELGAHAIAAPTDVSDEAAVQRLREAALVEFGRIDVWFNDAAVYLIGTVEQTPSEAFRRVFETNVIGVVNGSRAAAEQFRMQGGGIIINMGSMAGRAPYAEASAYCASKHAVHAISEALRQELRDSNIHVCIVAPATVDTPFFQHAGNFTGREIRAMRPIYAPERVARAIVSCAKRPRRMVTVGATPRLTWMAHSLFTSAYERAQPKMVERDHLGPAGAALSRGNLDAPTEPHRVHGGWKRRRANGRRAASAALKLAAAVAPIAATAVIARAVG